MRFGLLLALFGLRALCSTAQPVPPSRLFHLAGWKLQLPGPTEIKQLNGYASGYFYLAPDSAMCFALDAAETGATKNSTYVRAELRHLPTWPVAATHGLTVAVKTQSTVEPYQVTVAQIHGITAAGDNAPPLLRVAYVNGDLYAYLKSDATGNATDKILLLADAAGRYNTVDVRTGNGTLTVAVNGHPALQKDVSYWPFLNYFKTGCYPQAHAGTFVVAVKKLSVL